MKLSYQVLGGLFLAAAVCAAPIPGTVDAVIEWAKENNIEIPNAGGSTAESADAIVEWAKTKGFDVTSDGETVKPAPNSADALMEWANAHSVKVPYVGAAFEGTADYSVY